MLEGAVAVLALVKESLLVPIPTTPTLSRRRQDELTLLWTQADVIVPSDVDEVLLSGCDEGETEPIVVPE